MRKLLFGKKLKINLTSRFFYWKAGCDLVDILKLALAVLMAEKGVVKNEKSEENREERNQNK